MHSMPTQNDIPRQLAITDMNLCDPIQSPELRAFLKLLCFAKPYFLLNFYRINYEDIF
ncbi:hypothetical protein IFVP182_C290160 [Vibrio parahaemolyticus]